MRCESLSEMQCFAESRVINSLNQPALIKSA
jgi:hypothetical protein